MAANPSLSADAARRQTGRDGDLLRRYPPQAKPEDIAADIDAVL